MKKLFVSSVLVLLGCQFTSAAPRTVIYDYITVRSNLNVVGSFTGSGGGSNSSGGLSRGASITNPAFYDFGATNKAYFIVTNRALYVPSASGQSNGLSLYMVVDPAVTVLSDIGFYDPVTGQFSGMTRFPKHSGVEPELVVGGNGSTAIQWATESIPGVALQPNRSLQIGVTTGFGRLENIYLQSVFNSYALANCGYSIPFTFGSGYTSNGVTVSKNPTLWAHATDTNGQTKLTLYDHWQPGTATGNLLSHDFSGSPIRAEFVTRSSTVDGRLDVYGSLRATNLTDHFGTPYITINGGYADFDFPTNRFGRTVEFHTSSGGNVTRNISLANLAGGSGGGTRIDAWSYEHPFAGGAATFNGAIDFKYPGGAANNGGEVTVVVNADLLQNNPTNLMTFAGSNRVVFVEGAGLALKPSPARPVGTPTTGMIFWNSNNSRVYLIGTNNAVLGSIP